MRPSRSSGTIASSAATTRELSQRSEQLRVLLVHRTNIPPQFFALDSILSTARLHIAVPLLSQSAPKPPLMAGARLPCRRRLSRLVARHRALRAALLDGPVLPLPRQPHSSSVVEVSGSNRQAQASNCPLPQRPANGQPAAHTPPDAEAVADRPRSAAARASV